MNNHAVPNENRPRSYSGEMKKNGNFAEEVVLEFLKRNPYVVGIEDFRDLKPVHEADIDFAIRTINGRVTLAEVKSDYHLGVSNNVLFEALRINHTSTAEHSCVLGWSARSPATYFLFYAPAIKKIYKCRTEDFRKVFQEYTRASRERTRSEWINTDNIKSTLVFLIPWEYCRQIFTIYDVTGISEEVESKWILAEL